VSTTEKTEESRTRKVKPILVGMLILGAIALAVPGGTFATFNAATSNSASVTSGTLLLGNTVNAGTECFSTSASGAPPTATITAGNSNACTALFAATVNPTGSTQANLTLKNEGNLNAATSTLTATACVSALNPITVNGTAFSGDNVATPLCTILEAVVAEVSTSGGTTLAGSGCVYGVAGGLVPVTNCQYGVAKPLSGLPASTALGAFNAGVTRFFVVGVNFPDTTDNRYQGQKATVSLTWTLNQ
jgi:predicted ribosomally synthesized peptide with SipW-like signal peptide